MLIQEEKSEICSEDGSDSIKRAVTKSHKAIEFSHTLISAWTWDKGIS
jgi:hypothetical protein